MRNESRRFVGNSEKFGPHRRNDGQGRPREIGRNVSGSVEFAIKLHQDYHNEIEASRFDAKRICSRKGFSDAI